jgi:hypothetical protein
MIIAGIAEAGEGLSFEPSVGFAYLPANELIGSGTGKAGEKLDLQLTNSAQVEIGAGISSRLFTFGLEVNSTASPLFCIKLKNEQGVVYSNAGGSQSLFALEFIIHPYRLPLWGKRLEPYISLAAGGDLTGICLDDTALNAPEYKFFPLAVKGGFGFRFYGSKNNRGGSLESYYVYGGASVIRIADISSSWGSFRSFYQPAISAGLGVDVPPRN